jgi:hypothetical protein
MIFGYVKNENGKRIGVVAATSPDNIGWSMCHIPKDKFDKKLGLQIAVGRANVGTAAIMPRKPELETAMASLKYRIPKYFKCTTSG